MYSIELRCQELSIMMVVQSSKVWGEVPFPEDLEEENKGPGGYVDDEEYYDPSGDISGEEDGSTPEPSTVEPGTSITILLLSLTAFFLFLVYYRALVNFTNSFQYGPELDDISSPAFGEISSAIVDTLESDYNRIPGQQTVNVVLIKKIGEDVFVELDVGSDNNSNETQIRGVLFSVVKEGTIASYDTSVIGFQFRRLGEVIPVPRECLSDEFRCQDGLACIPLEYVCDKRPDCNDFSDEMNCATKAPGDTCAPEQFVCLSDRTCIPASYQCDEEPDCADRSDEYGCGKALQSNESLTSGFGVVSASSASGSGWLNSLNESAK
ncbi:basement membrane-specific heparan sulfate proteoglycan core -like protein [Labeo rohita]|uniref:Basement membrane-specific heparan sulfate proteoglycan core-like protein n=1 Tax=Labeo rohita TaxID=84645 RepID=A0A498LXZ0_LABRO|nr:basement membrane-specific heparan sulfate proteoglycan core -like protein [Labeo rohita]